MTKKLMLSLVILCVSVLFGCAHYNLAKNGIKLAESGNHWEASKKYFESLEKKPGYGKAIDGLRTSAEPAYNHKLQLATTYENQTNYESAKHEYEELSDFCNKLKRLGLLNFVTVDFQKKISQMKSGASEKYYVEAENHFQNSEFIDAIRNYQSALKFFPDYKDAKHKIVECYYLEGNKKYSSNEFRDAVANWEKCWDFKPGFKDSVNKASEVLYHLGRYVERHKHFRAAFTDYAHLLEFNPNYKDTSQRKEKVECLAATRIAFTPFKNVSGRNFSGIAIDDVVFELTKGILLNRGSRFIRVIDREELRTIIEEQGLGLSGVTEGSGTFKKLKDVEYIVFGKINRLRIVPKSTSNRQKDTYTYRYDCIKTNRKGEQYKGTCYVEKDMSYVLKKASISVEVGGSIKIVEVNTGRTLVNHPIKEKEVDQIEYASDITVNIHDSSIDIPRKVEELLKARDQLEDEGDLVDVIVKKIGKELGLKILTNIDITPPVSDPANKKELLATK